jgi:hypothetical protein
MVETTRGLLPPWYALVWPALYWPMVAITAVALADGQVKESACDLSAGRATWLQIHRPIRSPSCRNPKSHTERLER